MNVRALLGRRLATVLALAAVLTGGFLMGRASADQPRMKAALGHLQAAKSELEGATNDKGGHRVKALRAVNEAIEQVEKGIAFDRRN